MFARGPVSWTTERCSARDYAWLLRHRVHLTSGVDVLPSGIVMMSGRNIHYDSECASVRPQFGVTRKLTMPEQITRRETLRRGLAASSLLALVPDWATLAESETDVPFTDIPARISTRATPTR